jgi:hypothetical protein
LHFNEVGTRLLARPAAGHRMHRRWILAGLVALALLGAGCLGLGGDDGGDPAPALDDDSGGQESGGSSPSDDANATSASSEAGPSPERHYVNDSFTAEAANSGADETDRSLDFSAPGDAKAIVAEVRWDGTADMDLALWSPQFCSETTAPEPAGEPACTIGYFATGDETHAYGTDRASPAVQERRAEVRVDATTIAEEACETPPCEWRAHVNPNVAVDSAFKLRVSVFPHHSPPEDYSAFDE